VIVPLVVAGAVQVTVMFPTDGPPTAAGLRGGVGGPAAAASTRSRDGTTKPAIKPTAATSGATRVRRARRERSDLI
jgi:hypothetical protein